MTVIEIAVETQGAATAQGQGSAAVAPRASTQLASRRMGMEFGVVLITSLAAFALCATMAWRILIG